MNDFKSKEAAINVFFNKQADSIRLILSSLSSQKNDLAYKIKLLEDKRDNTPNPLFTSQTPRPELISNWASFMSRLSSGIEHFKQQEKEISEKIEDHNSKLALILKQKDLLREHFQKIKNQKDAAEEKKIENEILNQYNYLRTKLGLSSDIIESH